MEKIDRLTYVPSIPRSSAAPRYRKGSDLRRRKSTLVSSARTSLISNANLMGMALLMMGIFIFLYNANINTENSLRLLTQTKKELTVASSLLQERYYSAYSFSSLESITRNRGDFVEPTHFEFIAAKEKALTLLQPFQKSSEYNTISSIGY